MGYDAECHPERCPVGINIDEKVTNLDNRVRMIEVGMATISEQLKSIDDRLKAKSLIYPILLAFTSSGITGLVVYFITTVQNKGTP